MIHFDVDGISIYELMNSWLPTIIMGLTLFVVERKIEKSNRIIENKKAIYTCVMNLLSSLSDLFSEERILCAIDSFNNSQREINLDKEKRLYDCISIIQKTEESLLLFQPPFFVKSYKYNSEEFREFLMTTCRDIEKRNRFDIGEFNVFKLKCLAGALTVKYEKLGND